MAETYEGVGSSITFGTTTGANNLKIENISDPGGKTWAVIDSSHLGLSEVKTKIRAKLADGKAFVINVQADYATLYGLSWASNESLAIVFPDSIGTLTIWGFVNDIANGELTIDDKPTVDLTFTPSNLDAAGAEIAPAFA